jgi:hypothetical protein
MFGPWCGAALAQSPATPAFASTPAPLDQKQDGVFAADLDGDGRIDLAIVHHSSPNVRIKLGDGLGGFGAGTQLVPTMLAPNYVKAADLSGDGRLDLIVYTWDDSGPIDKIAIHVKQAGGGYAGPAYLALPPGTGWLGDVAVADVDADGIPDLVATDRAPFKPAIVTFHNNGGANFSTGVFTNIASTDVPLSVDLADTNLDGRLDAYAVGGSTQALSAWEFLGGVGGFAPPTGLAMGPSPRLVTVGDLNGDGYPDVVVGRGATGGGSLTPGAVSLRRGGATGFGPLVTLSIGFGVVFTDFRALRIADLNGDGATDIVYMFGANSIGAQLGWPALPGYMAWTSAATGTGLELADFDADGDIDLLLSSDGGVNANFLANMAAPVSGFLAFGSGTPGCWGTLGLAAGGAPSVGNAQFKVLATGAPPNALGLLLLGNGADLAGSDPLGVGCVFHVDLLASTLLLGFNALDDDGGCAAAAVPVPNIPALLGGQFAVQMIGVESGGSGWRCSASPFGLVSSRGAILTIQ